MLDARSITKNLIMNRIEMKLTALVSTAWAVERRNARRRYARRTR
jgi:hypothetical protein